MYPITEFYSEDFHDYIAQIGYEGEYLRESSHSGMDGSIQVLTFDTLILYKPLLLQNHHFLNDAACLTTSS